MIRDNTGDRFAQKVRDLTIKLPPNLSAMFGRDAQQHGCSKRCNDKTDARRVNQIEFTQDMKASDMRLQLSVSEIVVAHDCGPGTVHRVCAAAQREFSDPPQLDAPGPGSKYR
jgi:hypothetical protein